MAHFVCDIIDVEGISLGRRATSRCLGLVASITNARTCGPSTAPNADDMADIVVLGADHVIDVRLVHIVYRIGARAKTVVRISSRRRINEIEIIRDKLKPNRQIAFIDAIHSIHGCMHGVECPDACVQVGISGSLPEEFGVFTGRGHRQAVSAQGPRFV